MKESPSKYEPAASQKGDDDLTAISGIGPARQEWLRKTFNVHSYQDFLAVSASQIEAHLKKDGKIASHDEVQNWLKLAKELAARTNPNPEPGSLPGTEKNNGKSNSSIRENGWKPVASFVVEFQIHEVGGKAVEIRTAVSHMEEDADCKWQGIELEQLCQWIQGQIRDKVKLESAQAAAPPKPTDRLTISQLRIFQPPQSKTPAWHLKPGSPFIGAVESEKPFKIEMDFGFTGTAGADLDKNPIECFAQAYALNQATQTLLALGVSDSRTLKTGIDNYTLTLPEITLNRGVYRLWVLVKSPKSNRVYPDYFDLPVLNLK